MLRVFGVFGVFRVFGLAQGLTQVSKRKSVVVFEGVGLFGADVPEDCPKQALSPTPCICRLETLSPKS